MDSDMDFAFQLQLMEAINASLSSVSFNSSAAASSSSTVPAPVQKDYVSGVQREEIRKIEQEIESHFVSRLEFMKNRDELNRRLHDRKFAQELQEMSEEEWEEYGDAYEKPYEEEGCSTSKSIAGETFRVYCKGMLETIEEAEDENQKGALKSNVIAGIGVAVTDSRGQLILEIEKPLSGDVLNKRVLTLKAFIEGLNAVLPLDLSSVEFYCDDIPTHQFVSGHWCPKQRKIVALLEQVRTLKEKIPSFTTFLVRPHEMMNAIKLAKKAITSQIRRPAESSAARKTYETCVICLEDKDPSRIFSVDDCMHRFCYSCMKQHVEVKLLNGILPKCPHDGCNSTLNEDGSSKFLTPKLLEIMKQRIKEASIPLAEKFYCPIKKCSALMSKSEVREYSRGLLTMEERFTGARICQECNSRFCIYCKVPWHSNMSCSEFRRRYPGLAAEDRNLKRLATTNSWRQCKKCKHMIELSLGCYHITCRCGYEFCYSCGSEWKNKKATCSCPLWADEYIMDEDEDDTDSDGDMDTESDEDY